MAAIFFPDNSFPFLLLVRMKLPTLCYLIIFILSSSILSAQDFSGTPSGIRWKQIKTDTARIIYPAGEDSLAQRVASLVHYQQRTFSSTLGNDLQRINIVLRNELTYFNGYVQLGPFRSEYYLTPQQNAFELGAQSPADMLAIHEYRHVEQYNNFRKGLSKVAYTIFGQNGQALANDAAIPNWFFEGDAVYNETLLSEQGRGRLPGFFNGYKSLCFDNRHYSYMKLRNGSLKNYVPNHYPLGYLLVAYGREKYGADFWKKVTNDAARFKPLIYPWQGSVKAASGKPFGQFVDDAFSFYQQQWKKEEVDSVTWITSTEKNNVVNYQYPYHDESGNLIVLKNSYKTLPRFYKINKDGSEDEIALQSITNDDYFSYNNGKIVYAAYQPDTRWAYREYSVIRVLDINTKHEYRITTKSRYYSPDISHNSKMITAVLVTPQQHSAIHIVNTNGLIIDSLTNNESLIYSYPKFSTDDKSIIFMVRKTSGEMSLQQWNISSKHTTVLLPFANRILGFPQVQGDTLLYSCSNNGKDEIRACVVSQNKHYRLANYQTGLYGATITGKGLTASAFTSSGYRLARFSPRWQPVNLSADTLVGLYVKKPFQNDANDVLGKVPQTENYTTAGYSKLSQPFNFHSLQPDYSNPIFSLTLYGENVLSTIANEVYYQYNQNEGYSRVGYDITYGVSYVQPFLDISETFGRNRFNDLNRRFTYNELNGIAGFRLPLNLSGGKEYRSLTISTAYGFNNTQFTGASKDAANNFTNGYAEAQVSFASQRQQGLQHIYPHWAQSISLQYRRLTASNAAQQFLLRGALYLPGISASHSLVFEGAYQRQTYQQSGNVFNYALSDDFPYSRGYSSLNFPTMYKAGVNYHLPLSYPDFGVGNIVYIRRIRANFFFDYTRVQGTFSLRFFQLNLKSTGAELYLDTKWWNQQNITVGLRYSRLLDYKLVGEQANQWTLILPGSIFR